MALLEEALTHAALGAAFRVHNTLGFGFGEDIYVRALALECAKRELSVKRESLISVHYDGVAIGAFRADLLVNDRLIIEVKARKLDESHDRQILNYLRCTSVEVGLLIYFLRRLHFRRFVFRNALKTDIAH